jgi:hypothetical protein
MKRTPTSVWKFEAVYNVTEELIIDFEVVDPFVRHSTLMMSKKVGKPPRGHLQLRGVGELTEPTSPTANSLNTRKFLRQLIDE